MQLFRRVMIVGRALTRREWGPLYYSGSEVRHPLLKAIEDSKPIRWHVVFWLWIPPGKRDPWRGKSRVKDARPFELAALACGELEEVSINVTFPADMPTRAATEWLVAEWTRREIARIGFLPEAFQRRTDGALVMPGASALEQERRKVG